MKERRKQPRLRDKNEVKVTILSAPEAPDLENATFSCATEDVSASGLRLCLDRSLPTGATIELKVVSQDPSGGTFWHIGRAAWVKELGTAEDSYAVGVKFTTTPEATLMAWERILQEKMSRGSGLTDPEVDVVKM